MWHEPVLLKEMISFLDCKSGRTYVDVTLGGGGWAEAILSASSPDGVVIGFDRDDEAIEESAGRLARFGKRVVLIKSDFSSFENEIKKIGVSCVDGVVADLGVSSRQLDSAERGFSFQRTAALDMRMDRSGETSALDLVNEMEREELANLIFEYGEERFSRRIASAIERRRAEKQIATTTELADIISASVPPSYKRGRLHPATRTFQALRIAVNREIEELGSLLKTAPSFLSRGGRIVIASYHSLEDRLVKTSFRELEKSGKFKRITKKLLRPSEDETERNKRSRSAGLRVLEKI